MPDATGPAPSWRIRVAGPADAAGIAAFGLETGRAASQAQWQTRLSGTAALIVVAERIDGSILAVLEAQHAADEGEIIDILVAPEARRRGIARAVLAGLRDELAARGVVRLFLEVAVDNDAALALYTMEGFAPAARRRDYYDRPAGAPVDALVMRCDIGGWRPRPPCRMTEE